MPFINSIMLEHIINYFIPNQGADMKEHSNSMILEILLIIVPIAFGIFIATNLVSLIFSEIQKKSICIHFLVEFVSIVIPIIFGTTILGNNPEYVLNILIIMSIFTMYILYSKKLTEHKSTEKTFISNRRHFVTNIRSSISLITAIAILAVDFEIFPKRFAKTEKYGFSLMDTGVGLFMFSNGIVAPEINKKPKSISKSFVSSIPLIVLGCGRFLMTEQLNYKVIVSEYGIHWNFYITLAVTKIISSIILNFISVNNSLYISIFTLSFHECLLHTGLNNWVLSDTPRDNFITANREGIVSSLGYVGLYFFAVYCGKMLNLKQKDNKSDYKLGIKLNILCIVILCMSLTFERYLNVSRRLANITYCTWIAFIVLFMGILFLCAENISKHLYTFKHFNIKVYVPLILEAINYNALPFFLLVNIFTGIINISIKTQAVTTISSLIILILYMFISCAIITISYQKNYKILDILYHR